MSSLDSMYQEIILDHAKMRHGQGILESPDGESFQVNPTCGDQVTVQVNLDGDRISHLVWDGKGCSISQASISVMTGLVEGKTMAEAEELLGVFQELMNSRGRGIEDEKLDRLEDGAAFVGVAQFPARIKCALLGWMAMRDATIKATKAKGEGE
ncbi:SUF system NifU family Fe-S cluster assembly protein [Flaviflexus salsibiostraticola]|uniref:SUF system NifU family Fe-S cluster assembly protein n=1 Tax=Flaviflexus salsibiostraticola TaxID=1282737 RepID=A0A3Q8WSE9_9ACTO|nr:SUF system NifU family Fe-S cluster assembly protein [Flaviflexus salsibiostraticola]AZN29172.1 SUF system NifU family Fe-S cluster assembly protein [Flaviflexus salsibiostraticola]